MKEYISSYPAMVLCIFAVMALTMLIVLGILGNCVGNGKRFYYHLFGRCYLCGKRGNVLTVRRTNSYYADIYRYHFECLARVLDHPDKYGHRKVDLALDIMDCIGIQQDERNRETMRLAEARKQLFDIVSGEKHEPS